MLSDNSSLKAINLPFFNLLVDPNKSFCMSPIKEELSTRPKLEYIFFTSVPNTLYISSIARANAIDRAIEVSPMDFWCSSIICKPLAISKSLSKPSFPFNLPVSSR